jgi:hypothetical protein
MTAQISESRIDEASVYESEMKRLHGLSTQKLKDELLDVVAASVKQLITIGVIVRIIEERGGDLNDFRVGLFHFVRRIAYKQLLAEVVARLNGNPRLLNCVASLPIPDQRTVIGGDGIKVIIIDGNGKTDSRLVDPIKMSAREISQVFAKDHIRDDGEQISWIRSRVAMPTKTNVLPVQMDPKRRGIVVNGLLITRRELAGWLEKLEA